MLLGSVTESLKGAEGPWRVQIPHLQLRRLEDHLCQCAELSMCGIKEWASIFDLSLKTTSNNDNESNLLHSHTCEIQFLEIVGGFAHTHACVCVHESMLG